MRKKNNPLLIVCVLICLFLCGCIFLVLATFPDAAGWIEGTVVDSRTGEPVGGVDVSATDDAGNDYTSRDNTDYTRADGSFSLELPPGKYTINLKAPGYKDFSTSNSYKVTSDETYTLDTSITIFAEEDADKPQSIAYGEEAAVKTTGQTTTISTTRETTTASTTRQTTTTSTTRETTTASTTRQTTTTSTTSPQVVSTPTLFTIDPNTREDYGNNLNPDYYYSYYSDFDGFYFSYPPSLYMDAESDFTPFDTGFGTNVETHTFYGSKGSSLLFSLSKRNDNLNLSAAKNKFLSIEASNIAKKQNTLLDEYEKDKGYSRFVVTGYNYAGNIIYTLVKVTPRYVMKMQIICPPYIKNDTNDEMEKRYVQECIYRYCGFASDKPGNPRYYSEFLESDKK